MGGPRRPDKIIAARRREVMLRLATGATMVEISDALRVPYMTIVRDKKFIEKKAAGPVEDPDTIRVRALLVSRLLDIDKWIMDRIEKEHRDVKRGKTTVKRGVPIVTQAKSKSFEQAMKDVINASTNELVDLEEIKESYLPRISGEAALIKLRIELHKVIGSFYGLGITTKETHTRETYVQQSGVLLLGGKLQESQWVDTAEDFKEGKPVELLTEGEAKGDS